MAMAEMDLGNAIFEYGQTYVALSRIQTIDGLYLTAFHPQRIKANPTVMEFYKNIDTYVRAGLSPSTRSPGFSQFSYNPSSGDDAPAVVGTVKKSISFPVVEDTKKTENNVKIIRL
jgi:hypothetical protein